MTLQPGSTLGSYEILAPLGAGGMGEVYRAKDTKLGREVAIKLLLEEVSTDPERMARFEREARVLASLNHNNIATLHGFEKEGNTSFLVMELVEGETLADRIERGAIPVDEALPLFLQIAEGLEAAHEQGVIHRDLKPANIKITDDGQVKILDFGLAKAVAPAGVSDTDPSESPTITAAGYDRTHQGQILGTAAYMSPEQAKGKEADKRADIWAFGVCLYEALTGRRAFQADDAADTLAAVLRAELDWEGLASTPRAIQRLLRRCLRREPRERLHDIADARLSIVEALAAPEDEQPSMHPVATQERRVLPWALGIAIGSVVAGIAVWTLKPAPPDRLVVRSVLSASPSAPVSAGGTSDRDLAVTPDGRVVVYKSGGSLYVRPVDRLVGFQLVGTEGATAPFLSPDGAWVGFVSGGTLKKVSVLGGPTVTLCELPDQLRGASWGCWQREIPRGERLAMFIPRCCPVARPSFSRSSLRTGSSSKRRS